MIKCAIVFATLGGFLFLAHQSYSCNEAVCGSIVSKCLLTQSCKCDLKNRTCYKDCYDCLSYLYSECCSCVEMCPKPNDTDNGLKKKSHVEDFNETLPGLFKALTEAPDEKRRFNSTTFPVDIDMSQYYGPKKQIKIVMKSAEQEVVPNKPNIITLNCTVAFLSEYMSLGKCKRNCQSMGAASYRWFHDGCCQCIGENCINYGINESRCPLEVNDNDNEVNDTDEEIDYGESDDLYNDRDD